MAFVAILKKRSLALPRPHQNTKELHEHKNVIGILKRCEELHEPPTN